MSMLEEYLLHCYLLFNESTESFVFKLLFVCGPIWREYFISAQWLTCHVRILGWKKETLQSMPLVSQLYIL